MTKVNRATAEAILHKLCDAYPNKLKAKELGYEQTDPTLHANATYLAELELIKPTMHTGLDGKRSVIDAKATAKGVGFLERDGGLSAELGVVTIRLEAETIRALLAAKVASSDLPAAEKEGLLATIKSLPSEALKAATAALVSAGLDHAPDTLQLIRNLLGHSG